MALADTISALLPGRIAANPYVPSGPVLASPSLSSVDTTPVAAPIISAPTATAPAIRSAVSLAPQLQSAVAERDRLQNTGSGISQVQNKYARAGLTALDTIARIGGSVFAPLNVLEHELPGTSGHHDVLIHRADQRIANEQAQQGAQLQQEDEQAQVTQRQAQAVQAQADAYEKMHPKVKPVTGKILTAQDGSAAGYQRDDGSIVPLTDPSVPQGVRDVAGNFAAKPAPVPTSEKEIGDEEAKARNAIWDKFAQSHHLPTGQFTAHMSRAEANALAANLNTVTKGQQGDTRVIIQQAAADRKANTDPSVEREYQAISKRYDGQLDTVSAQIANIQEARRLINSGAVGQALGQIKTLSSLAGGKGSGVRITQAELGALANSRGLAGDFEGTINKLQGQGNLAPQQLKQINAILADAEAAATSKAGRVNDGLDRLGRAGSTKELRQIDSELRHMTGTQAGTQTSGALNIKRDAQGRIIGVE